MSCPRQLNSHGNPLTTHVLLRPNTALCKLAVDFMAGTVHTQLVEHGELELVTTWRLHSYVIVSVIQEGSLQCARAMVGY